MASISGEARMVAPQESDEDLSLPTGHIPHAMISQSTTRNGQPVTQAEPSVTKVLLNADVTLPKELRRVQSLGHNILAGYNHEPKLIEELLQTITEFVHDGVTLPDYNPANWPSAMEDFIEAVQVACIKQAEQSQHRIKAVLKSFAVDIEMSIKCVEVQLIFRSKESKYKFLEKLLEGEVARSIASEVYDEEFRQMFSTPHEDIKGEKGSSLEDAHRSILQVFLERIVDLITIHIYFYVNQFILPEEEGEEPIYMFQFSVASGKLLRAHHDTLSGDIEAVTHQILGYLHQDSRLELLLKKTLSEAHRKKRKPRASFASESKE